MRILFIIPWIPYPLNSGGAQAFFNMVEEIRHHHNATLLLTIRNKDDEENINKLKEIWNNVEIRSYDKRKEKNKYLFAKRLKSLGIHGAEATLCRWMFSTYESLQRKIDRRLSKHKTTDIHELIRNSSALYKHTADLSTSFVEWVSNIANEGFDVIQVEFYEYLPLIHALPHDVETVFLHHEIRFVHNANEIEVFKNVYPYDRVLFEEEKGREIYNLSKYKHVIVSTEKDKEILQPLLLNTNIYVSPAITEASKVPPKAFRFSPAKELVFMGNSSHIPNVEGLVWFCSEVMPLLRKNKITTKLYVTGNWDSQSRKVLQDICNDIIFTGFVDDINAFINGHISIIPIRIGSGMRMKIIDSIVSYSPIVTTTKGCEGLPIEQGKDAMIADSPQDFANSIERLLNDDSLQESITTNAKDKALSALNAEKLLLHRLDFYEKIKR